LTVESLEGELPSEKSLALRLGRAITALRRSGELGEVWELSE
jgi:hypothetical protein